MGSKQSGAPSPSCSVYAGMLSLPKFRQQSGVSLEQIADNTKISLRFLRAIEAEEFETLPGGIFSTSYLRQYAAAIGYDEAELLAHYNSKMNPAATSSRSHPSDGGSLLDRWLKIPAQAQR